MDKLLSEVCKIQYGYAFDSAKFTTNTGIPLIRIRDVVRGFSETYTTEECDSQYIVQDDDILIGMDGEFNIARWKGGKAYLNQRVCRLNPMMEVDSTYLYYFMPKALKAIEDKTPFVTVKHLSAKELNKIIVPIRPIEEQKRIAAELQKADELIALRKRQLSKLDELVKSRFVELFGDPVASKNKRKMSEIGRVFTGNTPSMKEPSYYESNDIPFIKPSDLNESGVTYIDVVEAYVSEKARPVARIIPPQAVLVTCIGTIGKIGITARESCCNQQINFIMPNDRINSVYLAHCLTFFKSTLQNIANAPVVPIINKTQFSELEIPVFEVDKQQRFAAFVEQADKPKLAVQQSLEKLETLKKSLMQQYFG